MPYACETASACKLMLLLDPPQCEHCKGRPTQQRAHQGRRHSQFILGGYLTALKVKKGHTLMWPFKFFGSPTWTRTRDLRINSPSLYQLSYQGIVLVINDLRLPTEERL